ncbi:MAG: Arm DNA-binding domain-containing protein [Puniceicoccales bacterium]|jgi:hypothetical protein|nr:Arm DNA-binding domain-containing protein [Puniceicoccales bacterium]
MVEEQAKLKRNMTTETEIDFTRTTLLTLKSSPGEKVRYYDMKEKGLGLCVESNGQKSFFISEQIKGKEIILGHFPEMTVEMAREIAQKIRLEVMMGKEKIAAKKTFEEAYETHADKCGKEESKPYALKDVEKRIRKVLPYWVKRGLSYITREEAQDMCDPMEQKKRKHEIRRALAYIRTIYNKMIN